MPEGSPKIFSIKVAYKNVCLKFPNIFAFQRGERQTENHGTISHSLVTLKTSFFPKSRKILLANKKFPQCSVENKFKSICNKISQNMKCNVDLFTDKRLRYFFKYFFEVHNSKLKELNWEFGSEKFIFLSTLTIIHHCFICQRF